MLPTRASVASATRRAGCCKAYGERFGREEVAARAAGGDEDERRRRHRAGHADARGPSTIAARGRRRVSAIEEAHAERQRIAATSRRRR